MKKSRVIFSLTACLLSGALSAALAGCAAEKDETYSTEHDPKYKITYLFTDFELKNHYNAEGVAAGGGRGYMYMYDDPNTDLDYIEPRPQDSTMCKREDGSLLDPYPKACNIATGYDVNHTNKFEKFHSTRSFHMTGTTAGEGVGYGTYFANYSFLALTDPEDSNKIMRDKNGNIPAYFTEGREDDDGNPLCMDDLEFSSVIPDEYKNEDTRIIFEDRHEGDMLGKYKVEGSFYSAGYIWTNDSGKEKFKLSYDNTDNIMKEPRCLGDMGQEGFVMWATGNTAVEVVLAMPESAPLTDGGLCDEDAMEKCFDYHFVRFELDGAWREYHASWDQFIQKGWGTPVAFDPNRIVNFQVKVPAPEHGTKNFDIWLDHIGFYGGKKWPFMDILADTEEIVEDTEEAVETEDTETVDTETADTETADTETETDTGTE